MTANRNKTNVYHNKYMTANTNKTEQVVSHISFISRSVGWINGIH